MWDTALAVAAKRISDLIRREIIDYCRSGNTGTAASLKFGVSQKFVFTLLKQASVDLPRHPRKLSLDETVLDAITPSSAYWIGFIFADGYITCDHPKRSPKIVVHLAETDIAHLKKLRSFFRSEHKLVREEASETTYGGPSYFWSVRSRNLYNRLREYGKALGAETVPVRELAASRDFWRGVVDGDGCVGSTSTEGRHYADFKLYGHAPLLEKFISFLAAERVDQLVIEKDPRPKDCCVVRASGDRAVRIVRVLYANNDLALSRKNKRAQAIIAGNVKHFAAYGE